MSFETLLIIALVLGFGYFVALKVIKSNKKPTGGTGSGGSGGGSNDNTHHN